MGCIQCGFCEDSCPKHCIVMRPDYTAPDTSKKTDLYEVPEKPKNTEKAE